MASKSDLIVVTKDFDALSAGRLLSKNRHVCSQKHEPSFSNRTSAFNGLGFLLKDDLRGKSERDG